MKRILLIALALVSAICSAQTYKVQNLDVLGTSTLTGLASFTVRPQFNGATPWDSANFNPSSYLTTAAAASIYAPIASPTFTGAPAINGSAGSFRTFFFDTSGSARWAIYADGSAESGSNAGSNLGLNAYTDAGTILSTPLSINRASGLTSLSSLSVASANPSINYQASWTGATARSYASKFSDVLSVRDFGADNTGAVNATSAIQAAMSAACTFAGSNGATVYFPSGIYLVSTGSFSAACNGVKIAGAGVQNTILNVSATATNSDLFDFDNTTGTGVYDIYINYLGSPTSGAAIENNNTYNFTVQNVRITGAFEAIAINGLGVPQFYNNIDIEGVQTNGTGIYINGGSDQYFNNVLIYSPSTVPAAGMHIQNSGGVFINGLDIVHSQVGLLIDPPNGSSVDWLSVMNADFDSCTQHGIYFNPATGGVVYGSTFTGVWSSSNSNIGVYLSSAGGTVSGIRFIGLRAFNNGQDGMVLNPSSGSVININVNASDFAGNSQSSPNTYNGITVGAGVSQFTLTDNHSGVIANYANTQRYGILVNTGASNNYIITNNRAQNNVTGNVQDNGTGVTKVVNNNL